MVVIWYNPDIDRYEQGLKTDYVVTSSLSKNSDRFQVLHEFESSQVAKKIADKLINNLNYIRYKDDGKREIFA